MLVFGVTMLILNRLQKANRSVRKSQSADWTLLSLLWLTGMSGFVLELACTCRRPHPGATGSSSSM